MGLWDLLYFALFLLWLKLIKKDLNCNLSILLSFAISCFI